MDHFCSAQILCIRNESAHEFLEEKSKRMQQRLPSLVSYAQQPPLHVYCAVRGMVGGWRWGMHLGIPQKLKVL